MVQDILLELWRDALLAPVTCVLLLLTIILSVVGFLYPRLLQRCTLHPYSVYRGKYRYTLLAAGFVHKNGWHLLINGFLIFYGPGYIEEKLVEVSGNLGHFHQVLFYFTAIIGGNTGSVLLRKNDFTFSSLGASTAVFGAFGAFFLHETVDAYGLPYGMETSARIVWLAILSILLFAVFFKKKNGFDNYAHLFGFLSGSLFVLLLRLFT